MAKNPIERYPTAGALAEAAHEALSSPERDSAETILRRSDTSGHPSAATQVPVISTAPSAEPTSPQPTVSPSPMSAAESGAPPTGGQPAGTPSPVQDSGPSSAAGLSRKRIRWPIVAPAALVVVVAICALGIWLVLKPSSDRPKTSGAQTAPHASQASNDDLAQLMSLLPSGYSPGVCTPATPESGSVWVGATTMVSCGQNKQPGGPTRATYGLFPDLDSLKKAFNDDISNISLGNCPGEGKSPTPWQSSRTSNVTGGQIACGTYNNPNLIWTFDKKLMLSEVSGDQAIGDLYKWWDAYS